MSKCWHCGETIKDGEQWDFYVYHLGRRQEGRSLERVDCCAVCAEMSHRTPLEGWQAAYAGQAHNW